MKYKTILSLIIFFIIAGIFVFIRPAKTEINTVKSFISGILTNNTTALLTLRYSTEINVLIESNSEEEANKIKSEFLKNYDTDSFKIRAIDKTSLIDEYKKYSKNLLSNDTYHLLKEEKYLDVTLNSYERLFDPLGVTSVSLDDDPYMLFSDFLKSLGSSNEDEIIKYNNKFYNIIKLELNQENSLNANTVKERVKGLIELQKELSNENSKIYLTGIPVSAYYENIYSGLKIKIFSILSILFICSLFYFYFKNAKLLIPVLLTTCLSIFAGYFMCDLIFGSIHTISLIASCILIPLFTAEQIKYFMYKNPEKTYNHITFYIKIFTSALMFLSGISVLSQISLFIISGTIISYLLVILFYKFLSFKTLDKNLNIGLYGKYSRIAGFSIALIASIFIFSVQFDDNIQNFYFPSKTLLKVQELFRNVAGTDVKTSFVVVQGKNFQDLLEKEESITENFTNIEFQAISKYIPSIKRQKENFKLRQNLYKYSIKNYATFLSEKNSNILINDSISEDFLTPDNFEISSEFLIDKNTSVIILYNFDNPIMIKGGKYVNLHKDTTSKLSRVRKLYEFGFIPFIIILFGITAYIFTPKKALFLLLPSILGCCASLGILSVFGLKINIFHIISIYLITVFGFEYSLYLNDDSNKSIDSGFLIYITYVFSSLLLSISGLRILSSIGITLLLGLTISYMLSLLINPKIQQQKNLSQVL